MSLYGLGNAAYGKNYQQKKKEQMKNMILISIGLVLAVGLGIWKGFDTESIPDGAYEYTRLGTAWVQANYSEETTDYEGYTEIDHWSERVSDNYSFYARNGKIVQFSGCTEALKCMSYSHVFTKWPPITYKHSKRDFDDYSKKTSYSNELIVHLKGGKTDVQSLSDDAYYDLLSSSEMGNIKTKTWWGWVYSVEVSK